VLAKLGPHHRAKLARLLADTPEFTAADVAVALELIDCALSNPTADDYRFIVSEEGDELVGYACFGATPMTEGCFDLYWLVVQRSSRKSGRGRELLSAVERTLASGGARLVRLETAGLESYRPARAFYEASGYQEAGRIRDFYWPGNDLYIYVKYLES
jgi:ribosomal protein S18 acetylase RimI-like enzyme